MLAVGLPLSPTTTTRDASLPLDARSMHCGCARVRWAAHATWYSAARASTPAHGDSLTHGSNTRRQTRVQPCSLCTCRRRSPRELAARCSIDALRLRASEMGCSRYMALGSTSLGACPRRLTDPRLKHTTPNTRAAFCSPWASLCRRRPPPRDPATRCSIDALRLRTSEMGCSRCMALGSTCQHACPR